MLALDLRTKLESVSKAHYSSGDGCLEGTRESMLDNLDVWARATNKEKMAWVHGHAGSGKSALLNSIAERLENAKIPFTYFPCKRDDPELSNIHKILTTIAYRLTEYYGDYRGFISDSVDQPKGISVLTGDVKKQSELLFGKAYELISPDGAHRPTVHVILIDALDECRNHRDGGRTNSERRALLRSLIALANNIPWIKVLITSRPEVDIVEVLDDTTFVYRVDINADKWKTSNDIRSFIEAKSNELKLLLSVEQMDRLNDMASGLFVWCATVFRYIEGSKRSKNELIDNILHSSSSSCGTQEGPFGPLYALYQRVLDSAVSNSEDASALESILGAVFVSSSRQPLSANAIADILFPDERSEGTELWVNNIVKALSAIIYVEGGTGAVRASHPSVLDFMGGALGEGSPMISSSIKPFSVRLEQAHARMFEGCFTIMNRELRFNICKLEDSFHLNKDVPDLFSRITRYITEALQYGSLFWISHIGQSDVNVMESAEKVHAFLKSRKTLFWMEVLSLTDAVDRGVVMLQDCASFFTVRPDFRDIVRYN